MLKVTHVDIKLICLVYFPVLRDDFKAHPRNTEVAVGDTAVLECDPPRGLPKPRIKWKKDGETIRPDGRMTIQEIGSLMIQNARKDDSGIYVCIARNVAGEKESSPARLLVRGKSIHFNSKYTVY